MEESATANTNTWSGYRWSSYRLLDEICDHCQVKPSDPYVGEEGTHCNTAESDRVLQGTDVQRHRAGVGGILHALNRASTQDSILVLLAANVLIFLLRPCGVTTLTTALGFAVLGASPMPVVRHLGLFSALGLIFGLVAAVGGCTWGLAHDSVLPVPSDRGGLRQAIESTVERSLHHSRAVLGGAVLLALWREPAREPSLFAKTDEEFYRYGGVITTIHNQGMSAEEVIHHHRIHHHRGRGNAKRTRWRGQKRDWPSPPALREGGGESNLVRDGNAHTQPSEADAAGGASSRLEA